MNADKTKTVEGSIELIQVHIDPLCGEHPEVICEMFDLHIAFTED